MSSIQHVRASDVPLAWVGERVHVLRSDGRTVFGGLSEVAQYPTHHRTVLYVGGAVVDVRDDATVTIDRIGCLGGAS